MELDVLEQEIWTKFKGLESEINTRTDWTKLVKEALVEIGRIKGYKVAAHGIDADWGEWLFDLVWYSDNNLEGNEERLFHVELVLESEWHPKIQHILYDFNKLLIAHTPHRIFVCIQKKKANADALINVLKESILMYKNLPPNFRCLVLMYVGEEPTCHLISK